MTVPDFQSVGQQACSDYLLTIPQYFVPVCGHAKRSRFTVSSIYFLKNTTFAALPISMKTGFCGELLRINYSDRDFGNIFMKMTPKTNPPICAHHATPPPWAEEIDAAPLKNWIRNQNPSTITAGNSIVSQTINRGIRTSTRALGKVTI